VREFRLAHGWSFGSSVEMRSCFAAGGITTYDSALLDTSHFYRCKQQQDRQIVQVCTEGNGELATSRLRADRGRETDSAHVAMIYVGRMRLTTKQIKMTDKYLVKQTNKKPEIA